MKCRVLLARVANIMGVNWPGVQDPPGDGRDYGAEFFEQQMIDRSNVLVAKEKSSDAIATGVAALICLSKG